MLAEQIEKIIEDEVGAAYGIEVINKLANKIASKLAVDEKELTKRILKSKAKSEYQQVCIVILREAISQSQGIIKCKDKEE